MVVETRPNPEPPSSAGASRTARIARHTATPYVFLVVVSFVLVACHVEAYPYIGPKDELQHIDYADKIAHFKYPRFPIPISQDPLREEACRRLDAPFEVKVPACGADHYDPEAFQEGGLSTQTFHPPLYHATVGLTARAVAGVLGLSGLVGVERMLGAVWLAAALCLTLAVAKRLGAPAWHVVPVLVMIASTEQVLFVHATVSNDATALFAGALALWAVARYRADRATSIVLVVVGLVAGGTKITNGLGVAVACLFAAAAPWALSMPGALVDAGSALRRWWTRLRPGVLLAGGYVAATVAWQIVFQRTQLVAPRDLSIFNRFKPPFISLQMVLGHVQSFGDPLRTVAPTGTVNSSPAYVPDMLHGPWPDLSTFLVSLVVIVAAYGSWMLVWRDGRRAAPVLGACASAMLLAGGPLQFLLVYLSTSAGYTETRYSFSVLPAVAVTASLLATRRSRWVLVAIAALAFTSITIVAVHLRV